MNNNTPASGLLSSSWQVGNVRLSEMGITASDCAMGLPPEAVAYLLEQERRRVMADAVQVVRPAAGLRRLAMV